MLDGEPLSRSKFNPGVWTRAIRATDVPDDRRNGMHVLRHTYASVLLDAGESIKALSSYLGHADPGFTSGPTPTSCPAVRTVPVGPSTRRSVRSRPPTTVREPVAAWRRHDHGSAAVRGRYGAGQGTCADYLALK
nr:tyrosine-type recombinase/integrase [Micromonospora krabiensis]